MRKLKNKNKHTLSRFKNEIRHQSMALPLDDSLKARGGEGVGVKSQGNPNGGAKSVIFSWWEIALI